MEGPSRTEREEVFKEAVAKVLSQWTLLNLAVELGWGERGGAARRQQLYQWILDTFAETKRVKADWLAEKLSVMLENFFHAVAEDDSDIEVAELLVTLHERIVVHGDFSILQQLQQDRRAPLSACREITSDGVCRPTPAAGTAADSDSSDGEQLFGAEAMEEELTGVLQVTPAVTGAPGAASPTARDTRHSSSESGSEITNESGSSSKSSSGAEPHRLFYGKNEVPTSLVTSPAAGAAAAAEQQPQEHEWATVRRGRRRPC